MCQTCEDGQNSDYLDEIGSCTFGCGYVVDNDIGMCVSCRDHSNNEAECEDCGQLYESLNGKWSKLCFV